MRSPMLLCRLLLIGGLVYQTFAATTNHDTEHIVPSFSLSDLSKGKRLDDLAAVLSTTGLAAVQIHQDVLLRDALANLCHCPLASLQEGDSALLTDGTTRRSTLATATVGETPLPLPDDLQQVCGIDTLHSLETLRDVVATVAKTFVATLDHVLLGSFGQPLLQNKYGGRYHSIASIVGASQNLEHFHVYSKQKHNHDEDDGTKEENEPVDKALDWHMDAGLFLAFVPGVVCDAAQQEKVDSFFVQVGGSAKRAVFEEGVVGIMLGTGAEYWIKSEMKLRATRHSVRMRPGVTRAWYGMMHLVPQSAIIQEKQQRTFSDMRKAMAMSSTKTRRFGDDRRANNGIAIGCGNDDVDDDNVVVNYIDNDDSPIIRKRARLQHVKDASVCNNSTNFYCWMSCLDIPQAENIEGYINEGYSLYCVDPSVLASTGNKVSEATEVCNEDGVIGGAMNSNCMGSWQPTAPGVPAQKVNYDSYLNREDPFCYGGTSMYMEGFQWLGTTCVIYLFPEWVLSTSAKLIGACFGTLIFGMAVEGVIKTRRNLVRSLPVGWKRLGVSTLIYGVQLTMGYFIMLVIMTYSGPLFLCVVLGLMAGHFVFNAKDVTTEKEKATKAPYNACCDCDVGGSSEVEKTSKETDESGCCVKGDSCCESEKKDGYDVPEGSTPCCQNTL